MRKYEMFLQKFKTDNSDKCEKRCKIGESVSLEMTKTTTILILCNIISKWTIFDMLCFNLVQWNLDIFHYLYKTCIRNHNDMYILRPKS